MSGESGIMSCGTVVKQKSMTTPTPGTIEFGEYELDLAAAQLRRLGRDLRLQPQPLKLLSLLVTRAGTIVTRDEIRRELWNDDTFVDFDQGMNFCVRQIREALRDDAERPMFVQTVPRRGYRFIAATRTPTGGQPQPTGGQPPPSVDTKLMRALWTNIAELKLADEKRRSRRSALVAAAVVLAALAAAGFILWPG
jgi:DNA-binding winged helix-turn-helix (wHTH) protein